MTEIRGKLFQGSIVREKKENLLVNVETNQRFSESEWMTASDRMWTKCEEECRIEMSEFVNKAVTSGKINIKTANVKWLQIESLDAMYAVNVCML